MATTTIYCYSQQCTQAGMVVPTTKLKDYRAGEDDQSQDIFAAFIGTEQEIAKEARELITNDKSIGPSFTWKYAMNVLRYLGFERLGGTREAEWIDGQYVVTETGTDNEWYSIDGDNWSDQEGKPITDETFDSSRIVLRGGPRDSDVVA